MRGNFEQSGTFPLSATPANGHGQPNPTKEYVITHIAHRDVALQVSDTQPRYSYVPFADATRYPDAVEATRAAAKLIEAEKLAA